ncbi:MAG: DEAD/DEAH box helicase [Candidatus Heimdallarchaeota archaeon]
MVVDAPTRKHFTKVFSDILHKKGIRKLTDIQRKAYPYIFSDNNLVIVSPSGSGKTLIAELIAIKDILSELEEIDDSISTVSHLLTKAELKALKESKTKNSKTIFLVPLRALAEEKVNHLAKAFRNFDIKIHMSMSEIDFNEEEIRKTDILISTFERFRTILGRIPSLYKHVTNVIIDEFHIIGTQNRGPCLETILTALKGKARLILLSATVANPETIANWLDADLILSEKRFIPLDFEINATIRSERIMKQIIAKNIATNTQLLVFTGTRKRAEELAEEYSEFIRTTCIKEKKHDPDKALAFMESIPLPKESLGNALLYKLVQHGTAFHNAGLSRIAQKAIEALFKLKHIKVLFCTETLGAGVNLPAREVIILDTKRYNNEWLSSNVFHQIAGRAGRPDFDVYGKCSVFAQDGREKRNILKRFWQVTDTKASLIDVNELKPQYDIILSKISSIEEFKRMILTLIYSRRPTQNELITILRNSFYYHPFLNSNNISEEEQIEFFAILLEKQSNLTDNVLKYFEKIYPIKNLVIHKNMSNENISTLISEDNQNEFTTILQNNKLICSCENNDIFCKHKILFLQQLPVGLAGEIISNNFALLDDLRRKKYTSENSRGQILASKKGAICVEMGITLERFEYLMKWLMYDLFPKKVTLTQLLYECINITKKGIDDSFEISDDFKRPIYEHVILGKDLLDVLIKYNLYEGDLLRVEHTLKSLISGLAPLAEYLGLSKIAQNLSHLDKILIEVVKLSS